MVDTPPSPPAALRLPMHRLRFHSCVAAVVAVLSTGSLVRAETETATDLAKQARSECDAGRRATERTDREVHFKRGEAIAHQAVALDDTVADGHFAVFCNMGELMRLDGETISDLLALHTLLGELDRTLRLNPDHTDALAAKGTFLVRLPRLLGGNMIEGEKILRQVIAKDPNAFTSRLALAKTCEARGDRDEAMSFATRALEIARAQGRADKISEAQATLDELRANR